MLKIIDYAQRENSEGEQFFALILQDGWQLVKSSETGKYYATAKKTSITSTFTEEVCKGIIGSEIPGTIQKVACESYSYLIEETREELTMEHRWEYFPEGLTPEDIEVKSVEMEPQTLVDLINA